MATNYDVISYTGNEMPIPSQYPTERAYAQAYQEWANRRETEKLRNTAWQPYPTTSDDNQNSGTQNTVSQSTGGQNSSNGGQTGQKGNSQTEAWPFPGKRPKNILGDYSSYTYSLSLYMVTPEYLNAFTAAGGAELPAGDGIFVVAQSGGVNNTFDQRLITKSGKLSKGQQGLDFYIEDLDLTIVVPGSGKPSTSTDIRFKIIEPNGFTFLTDLNRSSSALTNQSSLLKSSNSDPSPLAQKFILGIRFFGYDVNGNLVKKQSSLQSKSNSSYSDAYSIAERFIAVRMSTLKFKLDDKATIYNIEAYQESEQTTYGQVNGTIKSSAPLVAAGGTVREAIEGTSGGNSGSRGLLQFLNEYEQDLVDKGKKKIATVYKVAWVGENNPIPDARLVDDTNIETRLAGLSTATTTKKVNVSESFKAAVYNPNSRSVTFPGGTTITQAIDNLIVKSTYITESLDQVNNGEPETTTSPNASGKPLNWYSINPVSRVIGRDTETNDWAYEITYEIKVYNLPYARTQYKVGSPKYSGPFKYYSFMLTGENTEVLEYEQSFDNLFYLPQTVSTSPSPNGTNKSAGVPIHTQGSTNSDPTGGKLYKGSEINDNVRAVLYHTADQVEAKIKVLGDPDFIMTQIGVSQQRQQSPTDSTSVYGPDFTANPNSGQVFIQIVFNMASDYDDNGLMNVSDKIQFYQNNDVTKAGIKGVVYKVNTVHSSFSRGSFTQNLDLFLVPEDLLVTSDTKKSTDNVPESGGSGGSGSSSLGTLATTRADIRSPRYSSDEEADRAAEQSNYTLEDNYYGGLADTPQKTTVQAYADDDKKLPPIPAPTNYREAVDTYGANSAITFGTTGGGAALYPLRNTRRK